MSKVRACFLALIFMFSTTVVADIPKPVVDWIESNVVKIYVGAGGGTGFFIEPTLVITACHVTKEWKVAHISPEGFLNRYPAAILACDKEADLALLQLSDGAPETLPTTIALENPRVGKTNYGAGYPLGLALTIVEGHWQRQSPDYPRGNTAHVVPGDSGGPVVIWEDNTVKVVGVRTSMMEAGPTEEKTQLFPHLSFITDVEQLRRFLDERN